MNPGHCQAPCFGTFPQALLAAWSALTLSRTARLSPGLPLQAHFSPPSVPILHRAVSPDLPLSTGPAIYLLCDFRQVTLLLWILVSLFMKG